MRRSDMANKRKSAKASKRRSAKAALSVATSAKRTTQERVTAMAEAAGATCESDENLQSMLAVLRNKEEPVEVRLSAIESLAAAAFSVITFEPCRNDYIAALREVSQDADLEIRQRALGLL